MPSTPKPELFSSVPLGSQNQVLYMPTPHRALATSGSLSKSGLSKDGDAISPRSFASTTTASLESERSDIEVPPSHAALAAHPPHTPHTPAALPCPLVRVAAAPLKATPAGGPF